MTKERIQISFNQAQLKQLRRESKIQGESIATIVRTAVNNFFSNRETAK